MSITFSQYLFAGALATLCVSAAHAALDSDIRSVEADRLHFRAGAPTRVSQAKFAVHTMTLQNGTQVHEYVSTAGKVFGVTWQGRSIPDLRQILGVHYTDFATSTVRNRNGLGHLMVQDNATHPNLIVESHGRLPNFHGRAYLLQAIPAGVTAADIQ